MLFFQKLTQPNQSHQTLERILKSVPPTSSDLRTQLHWVGRLMNWVRAPSITYLQLKIKKSEWHTQQIQYILQILEIDHGLKTNVSSILQSIIRNTRALELFMNVGMPNQHGFIGEFFERLNLLILPQAPYDQDLVSLFSETFRFESDAEWISEMDPATFQACMKLFSDSSESPNLDHSKLRIDVEDALFLLGQSVRSIGLSRLVRNRVAENNFRKLPFFELTDRIDTFLHSQGTERLTSYKALIHNLNQCFATVDEIRQHFQKHGVNIELVYQVKRLKALMHRIHILSRLLSHQESDALFIQEFIGILVRENLASRKIKKLLQSNLVLLSQKIVETNAETGEHYITRDRNEHWKILQKSLGGGALTGITTLFKFLLFRLSAPPFIMGVFSFSNYALSFITIQSLDLTLATKQPAMTASTLASKIEETNESIDALVDEIIHLVRSQLTAVIGNICGVVSIAILLNLLCSQLGLQLTDTLHAQKMIQSFSLLGPTPWYAAGTGILLWCSSLFSGWFSNWFNFQKLPEAIEYHHRIQYLFGTARTQRFSLFLRKHIGGLASNLSLAFLLAMTPLIATFFGIPFDVRHVTLSSGALAIASMTMGREIFSDWNFWLAIAGIFSMAILNLSVAFSLSLGVAIWAKKVLAPKRSVIYKALLKKFLQKPWIFIFPSAHPK